MSSLCGIVFLCSLVALMVALTGCNPGEKGEALHGLIYNDGKGLQVMTDETPRTLLECSSLAMCDAISLSRSGNQVAYSRTGQDLWLTDLASGDSVQLVDGAIRSEHADVMRIAWSYNDEWLAVLLGQIYEEARPEPERATLFAIETRGGWVVELASGVLDFSWLSSSARIVFLKGAGEEPWGLYLAHPGGDAMRLVYKELFPGAFVAPSPSDDTLVVVGHRTSEDRRPTLLLINPDDGSVEDLLRDFPHFDQLQSVEWPAWSPDGTRIAFFSYSTLYIVHVPTRAVEKIATGVPSRLAWSPDGKMLAAASNTVYRLTLEDRVMTKWFDADFLWPCPFEWR